jgi:3-hydroxy-D-aspartate aldolase
VALAQAVAAAPGLRFAGVQAYHGSAQHVRAFAERRDRIAAAVAQVRETVAALAAAGLPCETVTGAGTGTFAFEGASGVYTEIQCGSYAFMDADYARVLGEDGRPMATFGHSAFVLAGVMSAPAPGRAVCDAGLKVLSLDSGLPVVQGRPGVTYAKASDEHGVLDDPGGTLRLNDRVRLIPGHIDPTCNLHDWYVAVRGGVVEAVWPVTARGKAF